MDEIRPLMIFNIVAGLLGIIVALGIMLIPHIIAALEKKLDKTFSTQRLEELLNKRRNFSEILLKHPRLFGLILLVVSFLLFVSGMTFF